MVSTMVASSARLFRATKTGLRWPDDLRKLEVGREFREQYARARGWADDGSEKLTKPNIRLLGKTHVAGRLNK